MRPLPVGEAFANRYEVQAVIGVGGMGTVYRVLDRALGEVVALKVLFPLGAGTAFGEESLERFRREVRVARRVTHRNVCRTFDLGEHDGVHYLTMELVDGQSLEDLIAGAGALDPVRTARIAVEICSGLAAAHEAGIVHRDLKPANVLLARDGRVVLTDFGIARPLEDPGGRVHTVGAIGTPAYMAPEQVSGGSVDARTDLYALGVLLYEALTGRVPFEERTPLGTALARLERVPADPRSLAAIPDALASVVLQCLEREAAKRPASAAAVGAALSAFAGDEPSATAQTVAVPTPRTGSSTATAAGEPGLAVLPFEYRGPPEYEYLATGLTEELIDNLSMTRGLRVLARGATTRVGRDRDPMAIGAALGVDTIVDGSVRGSSDRLRITARLIRVATGEQIWSERFDGRVEDAFAFEEMMSRRVAEALRVPLTTVSREAAPPAEVVHLYFRARRTGSGFRWTGAESAAELLARCIELAPGFRPAIAAHAIARVRLWYLPLQLDPKEAEHAARASVERALAEAPDFAETHLADSMYSVQLGEYGRAARAVERALQVAPTFAEALEFLGSLLVEAGRFDDGRARLREAAELDPNLSTGIVTEARSYALVGRWDEYDQRIASLTERASASYPPLIQLRLRVGLWRGELDAVRDSLRRIGDTQVIAMEGLTIPARYMLGEIGVDETEGILAQVRPRANPRFLAYLDQLATEAHAARGEIDLAESHLLQAADGILADLGWLDLCPVLAPLRGRPAFAQARRKVQARAEEIWRR